jgi:hypothetical protein
MRNQDGKVKRVQVPAGRSSLRNTSVSDWRSGTDVAVWSRSAQPAPVRPWRNSLSSHT